MSNHFKDDSYSLSDNQHQNLSGTLRITNPKTIRRWKESGKWQAMIDDGYIYASGCGRFRKHKCTCHKCRKQTT